jgi:uncharacterized protein DUF5317
VEEGLVIIFAGLALVAVVVALAGGRLSALGELRVRAKAAILGALALQLLIVTIAPTWFSARVADALHVSSYALAVWFLWSNRQLPWLWVAALGGALNLAAIAANGGQMPAARAALRSAGLLHQGDGFANSGVVAHAKLAFLGDVFSVPKGFPFANVFSVGDVVLLVGAALLTVTVCGIPRLVRSAPSLEHA